jgi:hypothetical protein
MAKASEFSFLYEAPKFDYDSKYWFMRVNEEEGLCA